MANISKIQLPGGTIYTIVDRAGRAMIAGDFSTSTAYEIGDYVIYNDKLYVFTATHPAGAWNSDHVIQTTSADEFKKLKNTISGGVHYIGKTISELYDGATTNPIVIGESRVNVNTGDMVMMDVTEVAGDAVRFPLTIPSNTFDYIKVQTIAPLTDYYYFIHNSTGMSTTIATAADLKKSGYADLIYSIGYGVSDENHGAKILEFIWNSTEWNALGGATAYGELAFKDYVTGSYTKPKGTGTGTANKALGTVTKKFLSRSTITAVEGTTSVSKMTAGTAVNVATVDTAVRYGTADVGDEVTVGTADRASTATTVGNANVGTAVSVATQGDTFYYGTADVGTAVTVATAGTPVVYGNADVGTAVTYGNANVGSTTQNVAIANGATAPYVTESVVVAMDQTDSEMLVITSVTPQYMTQVTSTTSIVQAASSNTKLTPAKAADTTRKLTPVGGTTSITPAKSAGQTHSAVGVGGTTNITPAVTSTTTIYGAVSATRKITPAVAAPNTQILIPAKANGSITPWSETAKTVALAAASTTSILTGDVQDSYAGGSPEIVTDVAATTETIAVTVGTTTDTLTSK